MVNKFMSFILLRWKTALVLIFVLGLGLFFYLRKSNSIIKTASIVRGDLKEEMVLSGEITATNYAKLSFETGGKIVFVGAKEGEKVNKGKLISKLDTTILNSNYQIALSNLRSAEATVENIHNQVKDHDSDETFAQKDLRTTAESNKDKAYEAMLVAKRNLDGGALYSPFSGILTYLAHPFSGVYVSLGSVEAEIVDPATIYFNVLADQSEVLKIKNGQKVNIVLDSFEERVFEGMVSNVSFTPKAGESGSVYSVKVNFTNVNLIESQFKIAMTGDAKFITSEKTNVLYVPSNFVKQDKTGNYLKKNKKGEKVYIKTGIESEDFTEIQGDIKEGQVIYD